MIRRLAADFDPFYPRLSGLLTGVASVGLLAITTFELIRTPTSAVLRVLPLLGVLSVTTLAATCSFIAGGRALKQWRSDDCEPEQIVDDDEYPATGSQN